uniref:HlyD family efflux transporter periplasmic adaptor subunit n=1 Tax=Cyanobium sp. TaxID=2164130 RepID=UPI0040476CB9
MTDSESAPSKETAPTAKQLPKGLQVWEGSSVFVEQGRHWSSALIWLTASLFGGVVIWSFVARLDQTISVRGRLEPSGSVQNIESPSNGVVREVFVKEGQQVQAGSALMSVEAKGLSSRRLALEQTIRLLNLHAEALKAIISSNGDPDRMGPMPLLPAVSDPSLAEKLITARNQTQQIRSQLEQLDTRIASRQESLRLQKRIAADMRPVFEGGGLARNAYLTQLNQLQELTAEVATLKGELSRVIGSATAQLSEVNRQQINLQSELVTIKESISYRTIKAPVAGVVFDAKVGPFSVVNTSQILLKIVPENRLQAKVDIPNSDIGFVRVGMPATVAVDSFPSGEFGYIQGELSRLGSDALPPDPANGQFRFPAVIVLKEQGVMSGSQKLNLQSGMGVSANIKLRSRPAISILTDIFTRQAEGLKRFR